MKNRNEFENDWDYIRYLNSQKSPSSFSPLKIVLKAFLRVVIVLMIISVLLTILSGGYFAVLLIIYFHLLLTNWQVLLGVVFIGLFLDLLIRKSQFFSQRSKLFLQYLLLILMILYYIKYL